MAILPDGRSNLSAILRDIFLQQNAVIGPQVADIDLQQHNGSARRGEAILPDGRSNLSRNIAGYFSATECSNWSSSCGYCSATAQWVRAPRRGYPAGWAQQSIRNIAGYFSATECSNWSASCGY